MSRLRIGTPVIVRFEKGVASGGGERHAALAGQGRDSGGPYMLVEFDDGSRELVHPGRVREAKLSQHCAVTGDHKGCPREVTLGTGPCECVCHQKTRGTP